MSVSNLLVYCLGGGSSRSNLLTLLHLLALWYRVQAQMKDFQHEVDAAIAGREEAMAAAREKDKRCKSLETELLQLQEDLAASERSRKALQAERDELSDEVASGGTSKYVSVCTIGGASVCRDASQVRQCL